MIYDDEIWDYKTGDIFEYGESDVLKASYVRQLQLYAFLVKENTGRWPARGVLLPMEGPAVKVDLIPSDCERLAAETVASLERLNSQVEARGDLDDLAAPGPEACNWCPYQLICTRFWEQADESWSEQLRTASIGGDLKRAPTTIHGGAAFSIEVEVTEGTEGVRNMSLAPLQQQIYGAVAASPEGTHVRATGLSRRADGTLRPQLRTVIVPLTSIPTIEFAPDVTNEAGRL